ncbi:MAG: phosphoglucosamine mutase [Ignavibacteria bacterium]|nr:phosphoglucosamine mutase [Ignavibacteria bacterium]
MSQPIISISGIRGIPGESLLPPDIVAFTETFVRYCSGGPIVIGSDGRPSGGGIADIVRGTAVMAGADVIDIGLAPTPSVQLAVTHFGARGGIAITASHNPSQWNGLKFLGSTGVFLDGEQNATYREMLTSSEASYENWEHLGSVRHETAFAEVHRQLVLAYPLIDRERIHARHFRVVVDAVNASGSFIVPDLLRELGCEVHTLHCDGSGIFPHPPEPLPHNLAGLGKAVLEHGADLGIAVDPDADRLVLFTEKGEPFGEEYTVTTAVLAALEAAGNATQDVVVNLSTTRAVDDVAARFGATVHRTPVGEINVVRKMLALGALVGGEGSGGVIVPAIHAGRDSLVGIILVLQALSGFDGTASAFRATLPSYTIRKFKYSSAGLDAGRILVRARDGFFSERVNTDDGVRIDFARRLGARPQLEHRAHTPRHRRGAHLGGSGSPRRPRRRRRLRFRHRRTVTGNAPSHRSVSSTWSLQTFHLSLEPFHLSPSIVTITITFT